MKILIELGMPRPQQNERSALCLLALINLTPGKAWTDIENPLMGITPVMDWSKQHYGKNYAPNTRETFRRQTMHQFVQAGIALYNPDKPDRPVNSPHAVYQIEPQMLEVLKTHDSRSYQKNLAAWFKGRQTLTKRYAKQREMHLVPIRLKNGKEIQISPGAHSELIKAIVEEFGPRFAKGGELVYVGDTGDKWGYFDHALLKELGVDIDNHGKMPDAVIYLREEKWLLLIESVTSHGPVDSKRHEELGQLFTGCKAGLVYVSAFPNRKVMNKYLEYISWETEVWVADSPTHLIHFNGIRFLGPYSKPRG